MVVVLLAAPVTAEPLRLADVVERVLERGPEQAAIAAQGAVAASGLASARMFPNPNLSVLGARVEPMFSASLAVRLPILGQRQAEIGAAEAAWTHARREVDAQRWRLRRLAR